MTTTDPKIVLITGASRGLGRSMALHLAAAGVDGVGTYRTNAVDAGEVARQVEAAGRRAAMLPLESRSCRIAARRRAGRGTVSATSGF